MAGVVDTAAESGLIGSLALDRLVQQLTENGMKIKWTNKRAAAKGVGGDAVALGVALIPLGIGGRINGVLEATIVKGDVPFLLPVSLTRYLKALLNFRTDEFMVTHPEEFRIPMHQLPSGHVTIDVTDYAPGEFVVPPQAGQGDEFVLDMRCANTAMLARSAPTCYQFENPKVTNGCAVRPSEVFGPERGSGSVATSNGQNHHHNERRALRGWRVMLDKLYLILTMVALQDATAEWCPPLSPSAPSIKPLPDKVEDFYLDLAGAAVLKPLKAKDPPRMAASECTHPKKELKGGGNRTQSYIVCRMCHTRWESSHRAAELHQYIKEQKGGPLSLFDESHMEVDAAMLEDKTYVEPRPKSKATITENANPHVPVQEMLEQLRTENHEAIERLTHAQANAQHHDRQHVDKMAHELRNMLTQMKEREAQFETRMMMMIKEGAKAQQPTPSEASAMRSSFSMVTEQTQQHRNTPNCMCHKPAELLLP